MDVPIEYVCLALGGLGVLGHLMVFIRIDPIEYSPKLALASLTAPAILSLVLGTLFGYSPFHAAFTAAVWSSSYAAGVFGSMLVYRTCWHPLRQYPGPLMARLSQFHHVAMIWKRVNHFRYVDKMHQEYGDYVRIGPSTLSIADPDIVTIAHGPTTKFDKSSWYESGKPLTTLHQITDRALHDRRRRHGWEKAFTAKSLRSYNQRLVKYSNLLVSQLRQRSGGAVDARSYVNYFAFDVMGELAFGKPFAALEKAQAHWFIQLIHDSGNFPGLFGTTPWIVHCLTRLPIPASINAFVRMLKFSEDMVEERKALEPDEPDIMSHLLEAGPFYEDAKIEGLLLTGDARLLIVAGSDTTATTLTYALYHLAKEKSLVKKLRDELEKNNIRNDESCSVLNLAPLEFLNGFINECLRMHPPVPGGVYRKSPKEGLTLNGHFIPGNVTCITPQYCIQRSPKAFVKPNEFIPERWTSEPELVLNKSAWFPFLLGRYGCIGKQLALSELRIVISKLVLEFEISFAKGEDGSNLLENSLDVFTQACARLDLVFTPRN